MDQIWELRDAVKQQDDPVAILDRQTPEWRSRMPIDLGDGQARGLIDSLLRDAATGESTETGEFRVLRYITDTASGRSLVVEPRVPRRMSAAMVTRLVNIPADDLPGRFQLRVDGSRPLPIANGRVAGDDVVFSGVLVEPEDLAPVADREIRWFLQAGRRIGDSFAPRGGGAPADDLPWVFAATEDDELRLDLYAEGSVRTRFPRVAVACHDETAQALRQYPDCRCWETQPIAGRVMFDVEGDVRLDTPVGTCRIRTAQEQERQFEHRLVGARCFDFEAPVPVYRGAPKLSSIEPEGAQRPVPAAQVSWRASRGDAWLRNPDSAGVWRIRRVVDGETVFLSKICWAGADFSAKVVPGRESTRGFVDVTGASLDVACEHPQMNVETDRRTDRLRVTLRFVPDAAAGTGGGRKDPPPHVKLATRWPNGSTLPVTVPFPGRGARFVHPDHGDADRRRALSVESLYGWRALAISPRTSDAFRLVGELRASDLDARMQAAHHFNVALPKIGEGVSELPLILVHDELESLFAVTKLLDARIHLELTSGGFKEAQTVIRRFACDVEVSSDDALVYRVPARCVPDGAPVTFEAFSLENPGLGRTPLEPAENDGEVKGWKIPESALRRQTRVVLARSGDQYFAHPSVDASDRAPLGAEEARSLAEAASIADMEARIAAMKRILQDMVEGGNRENWEYLADLLDVSRGLPATTFDALDCLSDDPAALVRLLLRTPREEARARIWRLEYELPFTWLLVPVRVWRNEMTATHRAIRTELEDVGVFAADEVRRRADERLAQVAAEAACFHRGLILLEQFADDMVSDRRVDPQASATPLPLGAFDELFRAEGPYQVLLRAGQDFRWPAGPDREGWAAEISSLRVSPWSSVWADCQGVGYRRPLTDAPFGAAFAAALGVHVSRRLVHAVKLLRSHAPEWFDAAYAAAIARLFDVNLDALNHD